MSKKKKGCPYEEVTGKIDTIDLKMAKTKEEIENLVKRLQDEPEVCPDVEDSERALQDALDTYFVEQLLKQKPAGDA
jgi:hypothetical protein